MEKKRSLIDRKIEAIEILLAMPPEDFQATMKNVLGKQIHNTLMNFDLFEQAGLLKSEEFPEISEEEARKMEKETDDFLNQMSSEEKKKFEELSEKTLSFDKLIMYMKLLEDFKKRLKNFASPLSN